MEIKSKNFCLKKLESINYYKLKEFALPFYKKEEAGYVYKDISLERVIKRFYLDKNLRMALLYAIEKIEISFKNKIAFLLGKNLGAFGYLDFKNWINKEEYCVHYARLKEDKFKNECKMKAKRTLNPFIKEFFEQYPNDIYAKQKLLPIWLSIEILTFGDILDIYKLMTKKDRVAIADCYKCSTSELESWLEHLKLIRNMCAHNSGVIDIKIRTLPKLRKEWKKYVFQPRKGMYSNKIVNTLIVLKYLLTQVNPKFPLNGIGIAMQKLIKNSHKNANMYGITDEKLEFLFNEL